MRTLWFKNRFEVLDRAALLTPDEGLILEFGVATGTTIRLLAKLFYPRRIHGFDSFDGLPESWGPYRAGHFACAVPVVPANVDLVIGQFAEALPAFLATHPGDAALIHLDCDLYTSTKTVLDLLAPRIVTGTVIVLDEYFIVEDHERRAFDEFITTHDRACRFEARAYEQACVTIL